jgi:hypothetical protein
MTHEQFFYVRSAANEAVYLGFSSERRGEKLTADSCERRKEWIIESHHIYDLAQFELTLSVNFKLNSC